jgi:AcrR family transcriptional regulator
MSDIVERSGVAFGSLYQYFPDKRAIIGTLAERYDASGGIAFVAICQPWIACLCR